ncbi:hypothetical protein GS501_02370 [Saccharibacter sp. 17.LH.SD]|uniref:hypothetical protein n=1 Tax=Saccharibacter sp. 17.LH.SD TaxID=2689393 RepID=UPI0013681DB9|nr:hypothetical protein [Saccharibacter sp. 17.LH.SD]MXV43897.1 hypothetical protein [Saccharibacter sp. 17.LH.SD]
MANPNWVNFPGLVNMASDGDGRPKTVDLIPGRQRGTPLNSLLFNPIIRALCDLRDASDSMVSSAVSGKGYLSGDLNILRLWIGAGGNVCVRDQNNNVTFLASQAALQDEVIRAQNAEATFLPLDGSKWASNQIVVASGSMTDGTSAGGFVSRFQDGNIAGIWNVGLDDKNYAYAGNSFFDQNGIYHLWKFGADDRIYTPTGGFILEGLATEDGHLWIHHHKAGPDNVIPWMSDLQNEIHRAQSAEASLVSGKGYLSGDLNIIRLWIGAGGTICIRDQNGTAHFLQPAGDVASQTALQNEITRAQSAEASLVLGQGYGGDNLNVVRLWIGSGGTICIRDQAGTVHFLQQAGDVASQTALQNEITRAQSAEASLVSGKGYLSGDLNIIRLWIGAGGTICIRDQAGTVHFLQPAGDVASQTALQNEITRAQSAEASLVLGQGFGGDNLNINRLWVGSGGTVCTRDQNGRVRFLTTTISENNTQIQAFTVTGSGNNANPFVTFPAPFASRPRVVAMVSREDNASGYNNSRYVCLNINNNDGTNPQITTTGFWAQVATTTSITADTTRPWSMEVIAVGQGT